jgi:hypothetical protein
MLKQPDSYTVFGDCRGHSRRYNRLWSVLKNTMPWRSRSPVSTTIKGLTTVRIARQLGLSRAKVSRLLTHARQTGLIEIRVHDSEGEPQILEGQFRDRFDIPSVKVVTVPINSNEDEWLRCVGGFAANTSIA